MKKNIVRFCFLLFCASLVGISLAASHYFGFRINRSASLPGLIYRVVPTDSTEPLNREDCVLIDLALFSNPVIMQGVQRGYVNTFEPMMKKIGALPGDIVQLKGNCLVVNGDAVEMRVASFDSSGGKLKAWPTPLVLSPDHYWLVSDPERGFDSRYFGPVDRKAFTHKAYPLF